MRFTVKSNLSVLKDSLFKKLESAADSFNCNSCGECCKNCSTVSVSFREVRVIAGFLGVSVRRFLRDFVRRDGSFYSLLTNPCVFFEEGLGCKIYDVRPRVCRVYPFFEAYLGICSLKSGEVPDINFDLEVCPLWLNSLFRK